jgi:hypothetical protein
MNLSAAQKALVEKLIKKHSPAIRDAFMQAVYSARKTIDLDALVDALSRNDLAGAMQVINITPEKFWSVAAASEAAFMSAGALAESAFPLWVQGNFSFNGGHPRAIQLARSHAADLVQGIADDQVAAIRLYLESALTGDRGVTSVALDITGRINSLTKRREGGIIGLTSQQTDWVINARYELQRLDENYFTRALRDKRLDKAIRAAMDSGKPLSRQEIDKAINRYKDNWLAYRGRLIGENEAFTAQSLGRHEAMQQMLEGGVVGRITKKWIHGHSKKPRPDHRALDGVVKDMADDFTMSDGTRMAMPHDPRGGAKHSAKCKCTMFYRPIPPKE